MQRASTKYAFDKGWRALFKDMNIPEEDVLVQANLPRDLLSRKFPTITADEYYRFWHGLEFFLRDEPLFPLRLVQTVAVESFSPPIFACFCSSDLNVALNRLVHYKPLVGPLILNVKQTRLQTVITFKGFLERVPIPYSLIATELAFWVHVARLATRDNITPLAAYSSVELPEKHAYEAFLGVSIQKRDVIGLTFAAEDARKPFLTMNEEMWAIFEPQLNIRMQTLNKQSLFRDRVRACLMEMLASGQYSKAAVAERLAMSARTLQRRLHDENTSFRQELDSLREELARNYLSTSDYTSAQIAFLLGFEDPNSFFRAFRTWTGQTPDEVRTGVR